MPCAATWLASDGRPRNTTSEPLATAITSIGFDHQAYLGTTLTEIAREKAGILKPNVPCLLGRLPDEDDLDEATGVGEPSDSGEPTGGPDEEGPDGH